MIKKQLARAAFCAMAALAPFSASATVLQTGQSTDFKVDFSNEGDVTLNGWTVSCFDRLACPMGSGFFAGTEMLGAGESLDFAVGSSLGAADLFTASFTNGPLARPAVSEAFPSDLFIAAAVDDVFLRITATNGEIAVNEASLRIFANGIDVLTPIIFEGVEVQPAMTPVPLPASGMLLLAAGLGFAGMRWTVSRNRS